MFGIFYDLTGKCDYKQNNSFPTFTEKTTAQIYLDKYVNITGINSFFIMQIKAWHDWHGMLY